MLLINDLIRKCGILRRLRLNFQGLQNLEANLVHVVFAVSCHWVPNWAYDASAFKSS